MSRATILFLRGAGPQVLGSGLDRMGKKLTAVGHDVTVTKHTNGLSQAKRIIAVKPAQVIIVGHSMGATEAVDVTNVLITAGINVPLLGCLDCHLPRTAPSSVPHCISIKQTHNIFVVKGFYHLAKPEGYAGKLLKITRKDLQHVELDDDPQVQRIILEKIAEVTGDKVIELPTPKPPDIDKLRIKFTHNRFDRKIFFDHIREYPFDGALTQSQVQGLERLLDIWETHFIDWDTRELAYDLATAFHETGAAMQPIYEKGQRSYFNRYDIEFNPRKARQLGNLTPGDGWKYRGAGDVQNTGKANAARATDELNGRFKLGIDLIANPEARLDPFVSAMSLFLGNHQGWWTGKRLPNFAGYGNWNMRGARTVVNGTDNWQMIGDYAGAFMDALRAAAVHVGHGNTIDAPQPTDPVAPKPPEPAPTPIDTIPDNELTLAKLRQLDSATLRKGASRGADIIKLTMIVLDEREEAGAVNDLPEINVPGITDGTQQNKEGNTMTGIKGFFASKTIRGIATALFGSLLPTVAPMFGFDFTPGDGQEVLDNVSRLMEILGSLYAIYGRVVAKDQIRLGG